MTVKLKYLIPFFFLAACTGNKSSETEPPPLHPQPQIVEVNLEDGYRVNTVTGDTIQPALNSLGDTLKTGVPIPANGKEIHPDSVSQPKTRVAPLLESLKKYNAHPVRHKIPNDITVKQLNKDSIQSFRVPEITKNDTSHYLVNSSVDTILTGIPIPAEGKKVKAIQPQPTQSLTPAKKDAAISDLQYLDVDQGMNSSYVYCVYEDQNENLWFGTYGGGVSMYNGESFSHFTKKEGLSNNYVMSILEDKNGNLWFGTDGGGVCKYDGESFSHFTEKEGLSHNTVLSILEDKNGNIWFGTDGGGVSMYDGESFTHFTEKEGLSNNFVLSILEDKNGNIWFGTDGGGVCIYDGENFSYLTEKEGLSNNIVYSILEDKNGNLWFGTYSGGVCMYNGKSFTYLTEKEGLSHNYVLSILEDKKGNLWFCTNGGGVSMYNGESFTHFTEKQGLSNNYVMSILEDNKGNLWFGTYGGGVCIYNRGNFSRFTEKEGLSNNYVMSILEDKNGNRWYGTYGGGATMYNGDSFSHFTEKQGLSNNYVRSILEDENGNIWFGTDGGGVSMFDGKNFTYFTENEGLCDNNIMCILEDKNGNIWFGSDGTGVSMYNGEIFTHYTEKEGLSHNTVLSMLEDKTGNIWFGTDGGGVSKFDGENFTHFTEKEGLSNNRVMSILEDKNENLWFGTDGGGVSKYNGEYFSHFTKNEGLSNNIVYSILEVEDQEMGDGVFFATEKGLNFIVQNRGTGKPEKVEYSLYNFGKSDGLKGIDFFTNSAFIDSKNHAWWGGGKGLEMLDLNNFQLSDKKLQPVLKQLDINEQFIDYRNISDSLGTTIEFDSVQKFQNYPLNLELPYDKNHLTFHFAAIDWAAPHVIQYSYLMEGLNFKWSQPTKDPKAEYRNLPYGTYTLKIKAIGESGKWSEPFEYTFTIRPPWWHTWWARTGFGVLAVLLLFGIVRWRTAKLKQSQKILENEVDNATREIREQKEVVEKAHKEMTDSINYAERIQRSFMATDESLDQNLKDYFVYFNPKEAVSGDFYWSDVLSNGHFAVSCADSTGHGVPGAIMSILNISSIELAVKEKLFVPADIFNYARKEIINRLKKDGSPEGGKDGMDASLISFNPDKTKMSYVAAQNPIWIIREGELTDIKAEKMPVGKHDHDHIPFKGGEFDLQKGDIIYTLTDGFQDQFGGDKGKKFKVKTFKSLLLEIANLPMNEQQEEIAKIFEEWKGDLEQVDDVCIIGIKI